MKLHADAGKTPAHVKKDVPGFIGNRLQHALWREAISLVERGICDAETVDAVIKAAFGRRLAGARPAGERRSGRHRSDAGDPQDRAARHREPARAVALFGSGWWPRVSSASRAARASASGPPRSRRRCDARCCNISRRRERTTDSEHQQTGLMLRSAKGVSNHGPPPSVETGFGLLRMRRGNREAEMKPNHQPPHAGEGERGRDRGAGAARRRTRRAARPASSRSATSARTPARSPASARPTPSSSSRCAASWPRACRSAAATTRCRSSPRTASRAAAAPPRSPPS